MTDYKDSAHSFAYCSSSGDNREDSVSSLAASCSRTWTTCFSIYNRQQTNQVLTLAFLFLSWNIKSICLKGLKKTRPFQKKIICFNFHGFTTDNQSINQWISQSLTHSISQSFQQWVSQSVSQLINNSTDWSTNELIYLSEWFSYQDFGEAAVKTELVKYLHVQIDKHLPFLFLFVCNCSKHIVFCQSV